MPGQTLQVLQCYSCRTYQVQQKKKVNKWVCKMCGEKQSIKKIYGEGSGADCRVHVQKLNRLRGEIESSMAEEKPSLESRTDHGFIATDIDLQTDVVRFNREQKASKWEEYCEEEEEEAEEGPGGEEMWTTDRQLYNTSRKRKKNIYNHGQSQTYKSKRRWNQRSQLEDWPEPESERFSLGSNPLKAYEKHEDIRGATDWSRDPQSMKGATDWTQDPQSMKGATDWSRDPQSMKGATDWSRDPQSMKGATDWTQDPQSMKGATDWSRDPQSMKGATDWSRDPQSTRISEKSFAPCYQPSVGISKSSFSTEQDSNDQRLFVSASAAYEPQTCRRRDAPGASIHIRDSESKLEEGRRKPISSGISSMKSKWSTFIEEKEESDDSESESYLNCYQSNITESQSQEEASPAQGVTLFQGETTLSGQREATQPSIHHRSNRTASGSLDGNENNSPKDMKFRDQQHGRVMSKVNISKKHVSEQKSNEDTKRIILGQSSKQNGNLYPGFEPGPCIDNGTGLSVINVKQTPSSLFSLGDVDEDDLDLELQF